MRKKNLIRAKTSVAAFSLSLLMGLALTFLIPSMRDRLFSPFDGGPLGYRPQLEASAISPDGRLTVKVFRQRNPSYSWYLGAEMYVRVFDSHGRIADEKMIGGDGAWSELNNAFQGIKFEGDEIRISQLWGQTCVFSLSELLR